MSAISQFTGINISSKVHKPGNDHFINFMRTYLYLNESIIDNSYSQVVGHIVVEITKKKEKNTTMRGQIKVTMGSLLKFLGLDLGIEGEIEHLRADGEEIKQKLSMPNKVEIIEGSLKKQNQLISLELDEIDDNKLSEKLVSSKYLLLHGTFKTSFEEIKGTDFINLVKSVGKNEILIPCFSHFITGQVFWMVNSIEVSALSSYIGKEDNQNNDQNVRQIFQPLAIWS